MSLVCRESIVKCLVLYQWCSAERVVLSSCRPGLMFARFKRIAHIFRQQTDVMYKGYEPF